MSKRKYTKKNTEYWENKGKNEESKSVNPYETIHQLDVLKKQDLGEFEENHTEFMVDGKNRTEEQIQKTKELEELIGIAQSNPFGTIDKDVFDRKLEDMTRTDLDNLCIRCGFPPAHTTKETKAKLRKEFNVFARRHGSNIPGQMTPGVDVNSQSGKEVVKLLEE